MHLYYAHHSIRTPSLETFWSLAVIKMSVDIGWQNSLRQHKKKSQVLAWYVELPFNFPLFFQSSWI